MSDTPTTEQFVKRVQRALVDYARVTLTGDVPSSTAGLAFSALAALESRIKEQERRPSWTIVNEWRKQAASAEAERDQARDWHQQAVNKIHMEAGETKVQMIRAQRAEAERDALLAKCEDYLLWEPRKRGHAAAHNRLSLFVRNARAALSKEPR